MIALKTKIISVIQARSYEDLMEAKAFFDIIFFHLTATDEF